MPLRGDLIGPANQPGIFGRTVFTKFGEQLFEAGVELALGAVAIKTKRNVSCRRHVLVYVRCTRGAIVSGARSRTAAAMGISGRKKGASRWTPLMRLPATGLRHRLRLVSSLLLDFLNLVHQII